MSSIRKLIGARIKTHRKNKGVTQAFLAEILDCEVTTLGRYERGEFAPDGEQLIKIANFFEVSPMDFLPVPVDITRQDLLDSRATLIDLIYRIDNLKNLEKLISEAKNLTRT